MTTLKEIINNFNSNSLNFMTELHNIYAYIREEKSNGGLENISITLDEIKDIDDNVDTAMTLIKKSIKIKKDLLISKFTEYILKYKIQIDNEDESFFINKDFNEDLNNTNYSKILFFIGEIKNVITILTESDKKAIFEHLQILCEDSLKYYLLITNE